MLSYMFCHYIFFYTFRGLDKHLATEPRQVNGIHNIRPHFLYIQKWEYKHYAKKTKYQTWGQCCYCKFLYTKTKCINFKRSINVTMHCTRPSFSFLHYNKIIWNISACITWNNRHGHFFSFFFFYHSIKSQKCLNHFKAN